MLWYSTTIDRANSNWAERCYKEVLVWEPERSATVYWIMFTFERIDDKVSDSQPTRVNLATSGIEIWED